MRKTLVPLIAALCLFAVPALAEELTHVESGLQFSVPRGWTHKQDGDTLIALNPDETVALVFAVTDLSDSKEVVDRVTEKMDETIQDAQVTRRPTISEVNELEQLHAEGTGTCEGQLCNWDFTLVVGGKQNLLVVGLGDLDGHEAEVHGVYRSIRLKGKDAWDF